MDFTSNFANAFNASQVIIYREWMIFFHLEKIQNFINGFLSVKRIS